MTLESIKQAVEHLPKEEQSALLHWLEEREQAAWDAEIERDFSPGGRGMPLLERVKADIRAGKFRPMEEGRRVRRKGVSLPRLPRSSGNFTTLSPQKFGSKPTSSLRCSAKIPFTLRYG